MTAQCYAWAVRGTGPAQVFNRIARDLVAYTNVMDVSATFPRQ